MGETMDLKTLKTELSEHYKYRIELHAHTTPASGCSQITPKEMVETYKFLGYDAIAVTNHFMFSDKVPTDEYVKRFLADFTDTKRYGDELGLKVYLGAEIRFIGNINDFLIFGINEKMLCEIYELLPFGIENFREKYPMPQSVFIQAHPMRSGIDRMPPHLVDGMEVFNMHPGHNSRIGQAALYAHKEKYGIITAGSDFHHPNVDHEGLAAIRSNYLPDDTFGVAELLRSGDYLLEVGRGNIIL